MEPHIQVVVPAYNVERFIGRCLRSVHKQDYDDFSVFMIDDASTDRTGRIMDNFDRETPSSWIVTHNQVNRKMPRNLTKVREMGEDDDVIFLLDGDDFLPHAGVLSTIAEYYFSEDLWLTYGSYERHPDATLMPNPAVPYPPEIIESANFRGFSSVALLYNHPLTFRRWLLNELTDHELKDDKGEWFTRCYDHVLMMPMLELAANGHFAWLPEILYVYNEENPSSEAKDAARAESDRIHSLINARPKRAAL